MGTHWGNLVHSLDHSPAVLCCLPPLYGIHDKSGEGPPHPGNISTKSKNLNFCQRTRGETLQKSNWDKISNIGVNVVADDTNVIIRLICNLRFQDGVDAGSESKGSVMNDCSLP